MKMLLTFTFKTFLFFWSEDSFCLKPVGLSLDERNILLVPKLVTICCQEHTSTIFARNKSMSSHHKRLTMKPRFCELARAHRNWVSSFDACNMTGFYYVYVCSYFGLVYFGIVSLFSDNEMGCKTCIASMPFKCGLRTMYETLCRTYDILYSISW